MQALKRNECMRIRRTRMQARTTMLRMQVVTSLSPCSLLRSL